MPGTEIVTNSVKCYKEKNKIFPYNSLFISKEIKKTLVVLKFFEVFTYFLCIQKILGQLYQKHPIKW